MPARRWLGALLPMLAMLAGCVLTLEPLYGVNDVAFEPALLGTWRPFDANELWRCTRGRDGGYRVAYTDEKRRTGEFAVRLLKIAGERFLDFAPLPLPSSLNSLYTDHWVPSHTFARVLKLESTLEIAILDKDWLRTQLAAHPDALAHAEIGGQLLLTASTKELQRFLTANLATPGAFRPTLALRRAS